MAGAGKFFSIFRNTVQDVLQRISAQHFESNREVALRNAVSAVPLDQAQGFQALDVVADAGLADAGQLDQLPDCYGAVIGQNRGQDGFYWTVFVAGADQAQTKQKPPDIGLEVLAGRLVLAQSHFADGLLPHKFRKMAKHLNFGICRNKP